MKRKFYFILLILIFPALISCNERIAVPPTPPVEKPLPFAGTWVTNVASNALDSRENIIQTVDLCVTNKINNIFIVVWNRGRTLYPSPIMKNLIGIEIAERFTGRDPLQEMIEEAHKKKIKVHAWFEYGFAAANNEAGGLILQTKPDWAAKDQQGNLLTKNGFEWMNPFLPEVQDFMTSIVMEVVNNYDIDGVQGDDRLPALPSTGGYDSYTVNLYKNSHGGAAPPTDYKNTEWINWRANILSEYLGKLYKSVKAAKPGVVVSSAPSIHPWAKTEYLQDWPTWLSNGYIDMVIPQHYRYDIDAYNAVLTQQLSFLQAKDRSKFYPGVLIQNGTYNPSETFLNQMIESNRRNGILGEAFWFFEGTKKFPEFFKTYHSN